MATQGYSTSPSRNLITAALDYLEHAEPIMVLDSFGSQKQHPKRKTDTIVFRRLQPFNAGSNGVPNITAADFLLQEGQNPTPNTISYVDVMVTLQNWGILFKFTSKAELMYEDDIPADMKQLTGETMGEVSELIRWGTIKGGTSVAYANGSSRSAVNTPIALPKLRQAMRSLSANRARMVTSKLAPGPDFGTVPVNPGYVVFGSTDLENDIRNLPGFKDVIEYASGRQVHMREVGSVEQFRFILSPVFAPWLGAGSTTLNGMVSVGGTAVDVYPVVIMAADAWGQVSLKGMGAVDATILPSGVKSHANPLGQFGFVGGSMWFNCVLLNNNWMTRLEVAATAL